jgi:RNA recognition motif-containing protein
MRRTSMEIQRWIEPETLRRQVFIGNLPACATATELIEALNEVGSVKSVTIYRRGKQDDPYAFAFIEMSSPEEAQRVIQEFDRGEMHGKELHISAARSSPVERI